MRLARVAFVLCIMTTLGVGAATVSPASAQDTPDYVGDSPPTGGSSVSGTGSTRGSGSAEGTGTLPITGADIAVVLALSAGALGIGWVIERNTKHHRSLRPAGR